MLFNRAKAVKKVLAQQAAASASATGDGASRQAKSARGDHRGTKPSA